MRIGCLIGFFFSLVNSQTANLKWSRDTIVETEYQAQYCLTDTTKSRICADNVSVTQQSPQQVVIDSINFKVITPQITSSHAVFKYKQTVLKFAYSSSGKQEGFPWKFSEYNDSQFSKITIKPLEQTSFYGFEIDNCLFSCPAAQGSAQSKIPVSGLLIFISKNQRDTLFLMGLQSRDPIGIFRSPRQGMKEINSSVGTANWNPMGRLIHIPYLNKKTENSTIVFPYRDKK